MIKPSRRTLITGLVSLVAAPAVVRAASLMPVRAPLKLGKVVRIRYPADWTFSAGPPLSTVAGNFEVVCSPRVITIDDIAATVLEPKLQQAANEFWWNLHTEVIPGILDEDPANHLLDD